MRTSSRQISDPPSGAPAPEGGESRLSRLELCVLLVALVCICLAVVKTVRDQAARQEQARLVSAAEAVTGWVSQAHAARRDGAGLDPDRCSPHHHQPLSYCFADMVSAGQPFAGLTNTISTGSDRPAFAFIAASDPVGDGRPCANLPGPVFLSAPDGARTARPQNWAGLIIAQTSAITDDLSLTVNRLNIGYCDKQGALVWTHRAVSF